MSRSHYSVGPSVGLMAWPVEHVCKPLMGQSELVVFALPHCALLTDLHSLSCGKAVKSSNAML